MQFGSGIFGIYASPEVVKKKVRQEFYKKLTTLVENVSNQKEVIILGDLNARTRERVSDQEYGEDIANRNGEHPIMFCNKMSLRIQTEFFKHKDIHICTWMGCNQIIN